MTRKEKCELAISCGFSYNETTGDIFGSTGKVLTKKSKNGYIMMSLCKDYKRYYLYGHQFAYYWKYKKTVKLIDHKNRNKTDNRIDNLREVTKQENAFNMANVKGYHYSERSDRWIAYIMVNGKKTHLGTFKEKEEAAKCYRKQKLNFHQIQN